MRKNIIMTMVCVVLMGGMSFALSNMLKKTQSDNFGVGTFFYEGNANTGVTYYLGNQAKPYKGGTYTSSPSKKNQTGFFNSQPQFDNTSSLFGTNRSAGRQTSVQSLMGNEPVIAYSVYSNGTARLQSGYSNGSVGRAYNVLPIYSSNSQQAVSNGNYGMVALATVSNDKSVYNSGVPGLKVWGDDDDDDPFNNGPGAGDNDDFSNGAPVSGNVLILLLFAVGYVLSKRVNSRRVNELQVNK